MERTFQLLREKLGSSILISIVMGILLSIAIIMGAMAFGANPSKVDLLIITLLCTVSIMIVGIFGELLITKI